MHLTSYGAVREVTGSMHLLTTSRDRILLDSGMFQGRRKVSEEKNRQLPIDPAMLTNVVLSHAHIDHCGRIPLLVKNGFAGRIFSTRATADACDYLLRDSAHIQESDALYLNYKAVRKFLNELARGNRKKLSKRKARDIKKMLKTSKNRINDDAVNSIINKYNLKSIEPLYTMEEAEQSLTNFESYPYREPIKIGKDATCTFYEAGHILGSAVSLIKIVEQGKTFRILYTGDLGRFDKPILRDPCTDFPEEDREIDLVIMESTYGNRDHEPVEDLRGKLERIFFETLDRRGSIVIPSFAFGRTQELIYVLHEIYNDKGVPRIPVYIDSPLASNLTRVYGEHPEVYDQETHETFLQKGENPFLFDKITFTQSVQESMDLNTDPGPNVVISASGMCEAGRILHHLRYKIHNPNHTILIVGYMAENTLGRRIQEFGKAYKEQGRQGPAPLLKFMNKEYPLYAHVEELNGFSAHGDRNEMVRFLQDSKFNIKKIALVHGEEEQQYAFKSMLEGKGFRVVIPRAGESIEI